MRVGTCQCPSCPTRATIDPEDGTAAGSSKNTEDQVLLDSESSRENVDDSDIDTDSGDCILCSDGDEVGGCMNWLQELPEEDKASCRLGKGGVWTKAQLKQTSDNHQDMWGHDHKSVRSEWDCTLVEDHNSFEMWKMMVRTDQLLHIPKATGPRIYTRDSEIEAHGRAKTLVLLLKQYHAHYY